MRSDLEIEEILERDGEFRRHFVQKHDPRHDSVPDVDFSHFHDSPLVQSQFEYLARYLTGLPLLEDNFEASPEGHDERGMFFGGLCSKYDLDGSRDFWNYFQRDKLKGAFVTGVKGSSHTLGELIAEDDEYIRSKCDGVWQLVPTGAAYARMLTTRKIDLVREIEDAVHTLFWAVATGEAFEGRIHDLYEEVVGPMWRDDKIRGLPKREGDHYYAVRDLEINYRHLHRVEGTGLFYVELANAPLLDIMNGGYLEYGDVGLTREEARELDGSLAFDREDKDTYIADVKRLIAVQRRIFELTQ